MNKKLTLIVINDRIVMAALFIVCVCVQSLSCVWLFVTPWTVASQPPLSMEFPRQEYWSRLPFPPPGDLPDPGTELVSLVSPALARRFSTPEPPWVPRHVASGQWHSPTRRLHFPHLSTFHHLNSATAAAIAGIYFDVNGRPLGNRRLMITHLPNAKWLITHKHMRKGPREAPAGWTLTS